MWTRIFIIPLSPWANPATLDQVDAEEARKDTFSLWIDLTLPHPPMDVPQKYKDLELDPLIPIRKTGSDRDLSSITPQMNTFSCFSKR